MSTTTTQLLDRIRETAPQGQQRVDLSTRTRLAMLTAELLAARPDSVDELDRYLGVRDRTISVPVAPLNAAVRHRTVIVTGGSGCVGTVLLEALAALGPGRLISAAITAPARPVDGVEYAEVDIRNRDDVNGFFDRCRPEIVFHVAAQRDPGLAEREVARTLGTNLIGTANVAAVAERSGVEHLVYASTGKAVRPYTSDVYAGSKRIGELLMATVAARGRVRCSGARFTHVVDNSIILDRLERWCAHGDVVRLHCPDTVFYVQSARESAQLLLVALLAPPDNAFRLHVLRDLGWPVSLLDLALGMMTRTGVAAPLYIAGADPGYEEAPYPGLYDPTLAGDLSPLVNMVEAGNVEESVCPAVDAFAVPATPGGDMRPALAQVTRHCERRDDAAARRQFRRIAWRLFVETARATPATVLARLVRLTERQRADMTDEHRAIDDVYRLCALPAIASAPRGIDHDPGHRPSAAAPPPAQHVPVAREPVISTPGVPPAVTSGARP
jgi:nucleoside-diphosphate-sugar epimerase